jgi:hypothetical protein
MAAAVKAFLGSGEKSPACKVFPADRKESLIRNGP